MGGAICHFNQKSKNDVIVGVFVLYTFYSDCYEYNSDGL